jgi:hypothetical protein
MRRIPDANGHRAEFTQRRRWGGWVLAVLLGLGLAGGAWHWRSGSTEAGAPEFASLGLQARIFGGQVELTWDRNHFLVHKAASGTLRIWDGEQTREIPIEKETIAEGSIVIQSQSGDLTLQMEVDDGTGRGVSERVRVIRMAAPAFVPAAGEDVPGTAQDSAATVKPRNVPSPAAEGKFEVQERRTASSRRSDPREDAALQEPLAEAHGAAPAKPLSEGPLGSLGREPAPARLVIQGWKLLSSSPDPQSAPAEEFPPLANHPAPAPTADLEPDTGTDRESPLSMMGGGIKKGAKFVGTKLGIIRKPRQALPAGSSDSPQN